MGSVPVVAVYLISLPSRVMVCDVVEIFSSAGPATSRPPPPAPPCSAGACSCACRPGWSPGAPGCPPRRCCWASTPTPLKLTAASRQLRTISLDRMGTLLRLHRQSRLPPASRLPRPYDMLRPMRHHPVQFACAMVVSALFALSALSAAPVAGQTPKVHRLEASPATVAYGYYWSDAPPVLKIASGDIVDVDTLLTNTPTGLAKAGVPDDKIQASLKAIVTEVTGDKKGPGGHILTGPIYVEGAEPGDALEVKILSIDLPLDYGYNGCRGFVPDNCDPSAPIKVIQLDRKAMTAEYLPGIVIPLHPFFG